MGTSAMDTAYACIAMNQEKVENLQSQLEAVKAELDEAREVIDQVAKADCPKYMAHPQSVWWQIHVVEKARAFNEKYPKLVKTPHQLPDGCHAMESKRGENG